MNNYVQSELSEFIDIGLSAGLALYMQELAARFRADVISNFDVLEIAHISFAACYDMSAEDLAAYQSKIKRLNEAGPMSEEIRIHMPNQLRLFASEMNGIFERRDKIAALDIETFTLCSILHLAQLGDDKIISLIKAHKTKTEGGLNSVA